MEAAILESLVQSFPYYFPSSRISNMRTAINRWIIESTGKISHEDLQLARDCIDIIKEIDRRFIRSLTSEEIPWADTKRCFVPPINLSPSESLFPEFAREQVIYPRFVFLILGRWARTAYASIAIFI